MIVVQHKYIEVRRAFERMMKIMYPPYLYEYLKKLERYLLWQTEKIKNLEEKITTLETELVNVRQRPQTTIEKIEYKFDQLKIETLEGTLNIGITPNPGETIEDFSVNPEKVIVPDPQPAMFRNIQSKVNNYLTNECRQILTHLEERYSQQLDETQRRFVIEDIRRQIDERIRFYIQQRMNSGDIPNPQSSGAIEEDICQKVQRDIEQSMELFIKHLPREG